MPLDSRWDKHIPNCSLQQWIFGSSSGRLPDRVAFLDADRPDAHNITMSGYRLLAKQAALGLQRRGLQPGDRVLLFSGNNMYFPSLFLGVLMAGGIFTGANPGYVARELAYQLKDSGAKFMVAAETSSDIALEAAKQVGLATDSIFFLDTTKPGATQGTKSVKGDGPHHWTELLAPEHEAEKFDWKEPDDAQTTTCCLNYSSGTTGLPKGVEITHYNYVANGTGVQFIFELNPQHQESVSQYKGLCFLPLYHAYSQTFFVANFAKMGIPVYIMPSFDLVKLLTHVQTHRITHLPAVPPVLVALVKHPVTRRYDLSSLRNVGSGAAPLSKDVLNEVGNLLPNKEATVAQGWGMTEVTCSTLGWDPNLEVDGSSVGELMPNYRARLIDTDTGKDITTGEQRGELWVSGPTVMRRYWQNSRATAETIVAEPDGTRWLRTGDVAYVNEYKTGARFFIVDRIKELIKVRGNQVAPAELEALLLERPDVADAAVVGALIDGDEVPRAYIMRSPGSQCSGEEIAKWVEERVVRYKRLKGGVVFVDAIPKNPSGKILRKILRERAKGELGDRGLRTSKLA